MFLETWVWTNLVAFPRLQMLNCGDDFKSTFVCLEHKMAKCRGTLHTFNPSIQKAASWAWKFPSGQGKVGTVPQLWWVQVLPMRQIGVT